MSRLKKLTLFEFGRTFKHSGLFASGRRLRISSKDKDRVYGPGSIGLKPFNLYGLGLWPTLGLGPVAQLVRARA